MGQLRDRVCALACHRSPDNLAAIFNAIRTWLKVAFDVRVIEVA